MAAVTTVARVCNLALGLVGQRQFIDNLTENSTEAQVCAVYYESTRNELLQAWHWRFATKRAVLALTTETRTGWGYCYAAPADMLTPRRIWDGQREPGAGEAIPFGWELNDAASGHLVLTDMEQAELIYTAEFTNVALWPPLFVKAVAAQLAVYLAGALPVKPELMPTLQRNATLALQTAAAHDANAATRDTEADSEIIRERG
jgi:hypothetical protein